MFKCKVNLNDVVVEYPLTWIQVQQNPGVYLSKNHSESGRPSIRFVSLGHGDVLYISKNGIERLTTSEWHNYSFRLTNEKVEISILPS